MIEPDSRRRLPGGQYVRNLLTATPGDPKGATAEEMLLLGLFIFAALFIGEDQLGLGRGAGQLFGLAVGILLSVLAKYLVRSVRRLRPGFLGRGSVGVPASRLRLVIGVVARVIVALFMGAVALCILVFLLALPPALISALTRPAWIGALLGLPLSPLMVWGYLRITGDPRPRSARAARVTTPAALTDPGVYEVRFGWTRLLAMQLAIALAFIATGCWMLTDARLLAILCLAFFGAVFVYLLLGAVLHKVALRVDRAGMILRDDPVRGRSQVVPWSDIQFVVLTDVVAGPRRLDRIGVVRRDAPAGASDAGTPAVKTSSWSLDEVRLAKAIELNAPDVPLVDLRA